MQSLRRCLVMSGLLAVLVPGAVADRGGEELVARLRPLVVSVVVTPAQAKGQSEADTQAPLAPAATRGIARRDRRFVVVVKAEEPGPR
jgi:hypothetical protein